MDKDEPVLYSQFCQRVTDFNMLQYHLASVMMVTHKTPFLQI
jgi:hypothetical protein